LGAGDWTAPAADPPPPLPPARAAVLDLVAAGHDTLGRLVAAGRPLDAALGAVAELELLGRLRRAPGGRFVVVPA
ncbi:MAG TPA: hypothetical protein VGI54_00845, partial [Solirubrobacteraceae bacterium]